MQLAGNSSWRGVLAAVAVLVAMTIPGRAAWAAGPMGVNGERPQFVDAFKNTFSIFYRTSKTDQIALDADGWPTSGDVQVNVWDTRVNMPWNGPDPTAKPLEVNGIYALSFTGKAEVSGQDPAMFTIQNLKYDAATNRTTADLVVPKGQYLNIMRFTNLGPGGIKDVKIIRPGYPPDTKQLFTTVYLEALKPFSAIRFMDFLAMNSYGHPGNHEAYPKVIDWSDRRLTTDAFQTGGKGGKRGLAWEYAIDLANTAGKDMWINIPINATDDYVQHLAELIHKHLDPKLNVYIEYSNEVWNYGFPQSWYNEAAAKAENIGGPRRYADLTVKFGTIFAKEFGETTRTGRVRPVLVWQSVNVPGIRGMCQYIDRTYGPPNQFLYGVGAAYYLDTNDTSSVDACLAALEQSSVENGKYMEQAAEVAAYFGVKQVAYEGGIGMNGKKGLAVKLAADRDPRVGPILENNLMKYWFGQGGNLYCYYDLYGQAGPFGTWGLLESDLSDRKTPKYEAIERLVAAPQPAVRAGTALPQTVGQSVDIDEAQTVYGGKPNWPIWDSPGALHEYLLDAVVPGTYEIVVQGRGNSKGKKPDEDKLKISVDNHLLATEPMPAKATVELKPGLHGLWLIADGNLALGGGKKIVITRKE